MKRKKRQVINGRKLNYYRTWLGKSQEDVAEILNRENGWTLSGTVISNWENGVNPQKKYRKAVRAYISRMKELVVRTPSKKKAPHKWSPEARAKLSATMKAKYAKKTEPKPAVVKEKKLDIPFPKLVKRVTTKGWFGRARIVEDYR